MGKVILGGRYELENEIGTGGMAIVYKAHDKMLNRTVAVKILRSEFREDQEFIKRFDTEAKSAARLSHPNIVAIYDVGEHENYRYIVMEYVDGITLKSYIEREKRIPWGKALKIASQICAALAHAHERKIIHRDIKPHNIMVTGNGNLKVMDFGIARAISAATTTLGSKVLGSAHYLSPEQARGGFTDERSDLYSLGVCMYEMITGKVPFEAETTVAVAMQHLQKEPDKLSLYVEDLPEGVEYIVLKAMRKEQSQRYLSAQAMESDILRVMADSKVTLSDNDNEGFYSTRQMDVVKVDNESEERNKKPSKVKDSKKTKLIAGIAAGIVALVLVIIGIYNIFFKAPETFPAPNLKGLTLEEAKEKVLEIDSEITVVVKKEEFSLKEEKDKIIVQEPEDGRPVQGSKEIYVVIGLGEEEFELDDYTERKSADAKADIEDLGLKCIVEEETDDDYNEEVEKGRVSRQEPAEGTIVKHGESVKIYVSKGDEGLDPKMPYLVGLTITEAEKRLNAKGIYNITVKEEEREGESGRVIAQNYSEDERIDSDSEIILTVTKNKPVLKFTVPSGSDRVTVKVIRKDNGETVYKRAHNPNDEVKVDLKINGTVVYEIYINDVFVEEKSVQG